MHALRNLTKKLPERLHRELKARSWRILDEATSVAEARTGLLALAADYRSAYPAAMAVIERDLDALVCHLRSPAQHRKQIRSTNPLERTFVAVRRPTKVIGRFPAETSALCLIWAVLELSSRGWRGVLMTTNSPRDRTATTQPSRPDTSAGHSQRGSGQSLVCYNDNKLRYSGQPPLRWKSSSRGIWFTLAGIGLVGMPPRGAVDSLNGLEQYVFGMRARADQLEQKARGQLL